MGARGSEDKGLRGCLKGSRGIVSQKKPNWEKEGG